MEKRVPFPVETMWWDEAWYPTMTRDAADTPDRNISTEAEFDSALETLLRSALENGVDLRGAWEYRNGQTYPDLEILVSELSK